MAEPVYRALLIGNSTFPSDQNLQSLEGPVNDIALLRDALTDPVAGLFDQHDVRLLPERSMSEILIELERFFATASRTDRLLLYYSGHGLLTVDNRLLLAARDTRTDLVLSTTVSATAINGMIDSSAAQTTMIMLDCCYSGSFKSADLPKSLEGGGRYLLTSTRSGQLANDADRVNGTSQFTTHLVEGLLSAAPDRDGDGYVDLDDLYEHVHGRLSALGRQIPQRNFAGGGEVVVARRQRAPDPAPPPPPRDKGAPGVDSDASPGPPPVLDLSETLIDLRDVRPDEVLAPERVAVLNRGGGRLDWVAVSEADWLAVTPEGDDVRIEMHPRPGQNRGTVVVRDRGQGGVKTIRVQVQVEHEKPPPRRVTRPDPGPGPWWRDGRVLAGGAVAVVLLVILVVAFSGGGGGGDDDDVTQSSTTTVPPRSPTSADLLVDGAQFWTDTGLDVVSGDRVAVVATGEIFHNEVSSIGPEGFPNRPDLLTPVPEFNHAGLLGRVGEDGPPFYVGLTKTFTADRDGQFFLGVNDGGLENNRGYFSASVDVVPRREG